MIKTTSTVFSFFLVLALLLNVPAIGASPAAVTDANDDSYMVESGATLAVNTAQGILANDANGPSAIITHTDPANGTLTLNNDGSFSYTPNTGFHDTDSFSYTVSNAVQLYSTNLPSLGTFGGVKITAGGFGSSLYPVPGSTDEFYGLTDRGPNVDGPNGSKIEPIPSFTPAIGKFKFVSGQAILEQYIPLQGADGTLFNGQVNPQASTGETITDLNGNVLPTSPYGYDSEGLVALPDGTFWVSDEYGPFITHFDAMGKQIGRLSPFDGTLPAVLAKRRVNRGMEGLTITPDGSTLVGIMQSPLINDITSGQTSSTTTLRIVTYHLASGVTHQYLYLLDNPGTNATSASEITALSNTTFLVDERDGSYPPAYKKIFQIDLTGATDVGVATAPNTLDPAKGLLINGTTTIEKLVVGQNTATATTTLANSGITPVSKGLFLDISALLTTLDPQARFFSHDKLEGVSVIEGGTKLVISNDSDFGIDGITNTTAPFQLRAKVSPATGKQDDGEYLVIDLTRLPASLDTATVTFSVYDFSGFFSPLANLPTLNSSKAGQTISVKFSLGRDLGLGIFAPGFPASQKIACDSGAPLSGVEEILTAGSSSLSYDSTTDQYVYLWKTDKAWAGTCRQLMVRLNGGIVHSANFQFK